MKRHLFSAVCLLALNLIITPLTSQAEEEQNKLSGSLTLGVFSDYMFRGVDLYEGTSIQPSATVNYDTGSGIISANIWMHTSGEKSDSSSEFFEMDDTISYTNTFDQFTLKLGNVWYTYPDHSDDLESTAEVFATVIYDDSKVNSFFTLTPSFSVYQDYDLLNGQYYELAFSHAFNCPALGEGFNLTPFVALGFANSEQEVYADNGLVQVTYGVSSNLKLGDITVTPSFNFTEKVDDNTVNKFWFGTTLNYDL